MPPSAEIQPKIVVLDDSEIVLDIVAMTLEDAGYGVVTISRACDLVSTCARECPDLVLVDVGLPELGTEALADLLQTEIRYPILLFSDRDPSEMTRLTNRSGARGWVAKSDCLDDLIATLQQLIRRQ